MSEQIPIYSSPDADVVVSVRIRVARNLAGFPFTGRASDSQRQEVLQMVTHAPLGGSFPDGLAWVNMNQASMQERQLLVERHLVSKNFAESPLPRALGLGRSESLGVMVNEEDHLRIQSILPGFQMNEAFELAHSFDQALEETVDFAFHQRWGYLTACPTNVGCGIRLGAMLHLPALRYSGELERVKRAAKDLHLAVRGYYGEGTHAIGNFYQVSNQVTLGASEEELLQHFRDEVIPKLVDYERTARQMLLEKNRPLIEDKVYRARATLKVARLLGAEEATKLLSTLRFGICTGMLHNLNIECVEQLLLQVQPAHLAQLDPFAVKEEMGRLSRANLVRRSLGDYSEDSPEI
ncbi:MAG: ATP--guanido phosphotransferase [Phycisphaerales bacterium]|nr:ATP--guanido phosphotransferase [Phycisphaerales bacterium]